MSLNGDTVKDAGDVVKEHQYVVPVKSVKSNEDMATWEKSEAYQEYLGFINVMNHTVRGKKISGPFNESEPCKNLIVLLDKLDAWIEEIPPIDQPQRFGNKAFRTWFQKLKDNAAILISDLLPEEAKNSVVEVAVYFIESFGNSIRIDYGTGHEMSFIMFLCCLFKIHVLHADDKAPVALKVFGRYLELVRKLQFVYNMEPAGSHGVWSLDDYQFVPFIWGSSQLVAHPKVEPSSFVEPKIIADHFSDYLFLGCIKHILKMKTGPFPEHSNQLWNISAVQSWTKINQGLIKMYKDEVLLKFPVVQHVLFGSLFSLRNASKPQVSSSGLMLPPPPPISLSAL